MGTLHPVSLAARWMAGCLLLISADAAPGQAARPKPAAVPKAAANNTGTPEDPLRKGLGDVAKNIQKLLTGRREESIAVGQFTGPPNFPTSGGPGIVKALSDELEKVGVAVKVRAKLGLSGTYRAVSEKKALALNGSTNRVNVPGFETDVTSLVLKMQIEDSSGTPVVDYEQSIDDPDTISKILGLTFESPPANPTKPIKDSLEKPSVHVEGSIIRPSANSPYGIEILVRETTGKDRQPRAASAEEGLAFVPIERKEAYAVRLINDSPLEMGVGLNIDGLSMFSFSEFKTARFMVVPPKGSYTVLGWHRTLKESNEFLITSYSEGAAAMLNANPANVGTITATFHASWPKGGSPPADEPGQKGGDSGFAATVPSNSTGVGKKVQAQTGKLERDFGRLRSAISVRYQK